MFLFSVTNTTDSTGSTLIEPAAQQLNAFQRWWNNINWESIIGVMISKGIMLLFLTFLFFLLFKIGDYLVHRSYNTYQKRGTFSISRVETIHKLIKNIIHYTLGFFYIYSVLSTIGVPVGSLLAGAGIAGVAIGLGAQGFMSDLITGFFIIMEQSIDVGDYVILSNLSIEGTVTSVGIRNLELKSANGTVHYIPNRNITTISNNSRANMQVMVDVRIDPAEGVDKIRQIIEEVNQTIATKFTEEIQTEPTIFGLVDLGNGNFVMRTTFYVLNGHQVQIKEELLTASIDALTAAGFTIPSSPLMTTP